MDHELVREARSSHATDAPNTDMRVAVIVTARPSWAKLSTVVGALVTRAVDVQIIACASALLERYGRVVEVVRKEFPHVEITECWSTYEGANLVTSAKETGALCSELGSVLSRMRPSLGVVCADRHEVLAAAQAVSYLHIPLAHLQGGERSGSIDDKVRDSITALADFHYTATERAKWRVYGLTGSDHIYNTGCPSIDLAKAALGDPPVTVAELGGTGDLETLAQPFLLVLQHPVTTEAADAYQQMWTTLEAVRRVTLPRLILWPGEDAGAEGSAKAIRTYLAQADRGPWAWHTVRNLPPRRFLRLLTQCACLVGNSSAGIREASFLGVGVVNIGTRQQGRERARHVLDVPHEAEAIAQAIGRCWQLDPATTRRPGSTLYGRGDAGEQIAEVICGVDARTGRGGAVVSHV